MGTIGNSHLPIPPTTAPPIPKPNEILEQPSLDFRKKILNVSIKDISFHDIDPGVFNDELVKLRIYAKPNQQNLAKKPKLGGGNIEEGTYSGTQAALTHAYSRIERRFGLTII